MELSVLSVEGKVEQFLEGNNELMNFHSSLGLSLCLETVSL